MNDNKSLTQKEANEIAGWLRVLQNDLEKRQITTDICKQSAQRIHELIKKIEQ